jgi:hypothetical protein
LQFRGTAREHKKANPDCRYIGIEVVPEYARLAERYCDAVIEVDIESVDEQFLQIKRILIVIAGYLVMRSSISVIPG